MVIQSIMHSSNHIHALDSHHSIIRSIIELIYLWSQSINQTAFVLIVLFKVNLTLFTISAQSLELSQVYSMLYTSLSSIQVILKVLESFGRMSILMIVSMLLSALWTPVSWPPTSLPIYYIMTYMFHFECQSRHITFHLIRWDVISVGKIRQTRHHVSAMCPNDRTKANI